MADLKEQLRKEIAEGREVKLTAADLAAGRITATTPPSDTPATPAVAAGPVSVPASQHPGNDALIKGAAQGDIGKSVSATVASNVEREHLATDLTMSRLLAKTITVEPGAKSAFIESMISGKRFELPFELFGGKVCGVFRGRSQSESLAIINKLNRESNDGTLTNGLEYASRLRNMLLAAQVRALGNDTYAELKAPLTTLVEGPDKITPPAWMEQVKIWEAKPEGLTSALYAKLVEFEQIYWTMVDSAGDQNFWNPAEST